MLDEEVDDHDKRQKSVAYINFKKCSSGLLF